MVGFIADHDSTRAEYIEFFLRTVKEELETFAPATAQKNINLDTLSSVRIPVPPREEQDQIVLEIEKAIRSLDKIELERKQSIHLLDRLDQAALSKAFRGELVPQDPSDEPAEKLLERIRAARDGQQKPRRSRKTVEAA